MSLGFKPRLRLPHLDSSTGPPGFSFSFIYIKAFCFLFRRKIIPKQERNPMHLFSLSNLEGTICYGAVCALSRAQYTGKAGS